MRILVRKRVIRTDNGKILRDLITKSIVPKLSELCIHENCAVCKRSSTDIFFSLCNFKYYSHISKNIRILLLLSISNSRNSDLTVARENIEILQIVQMYGWRRRVDAGCGGDGVWLLANVKAGNAGFRIESYGIFVSQIRGTFLFCSN